MFELFDTLMKFGSLMGGGGNSPQLADPATPMGAIGRLIFPQTNNDLGQLDPLASLIKMGLGNNQQDTQVPQPSIQPPFTPDPNLGPNVTNLGMPNNNMPPINPETPMTDSMKLAQQAYGRYYG